MWGTSKKGIIPISLLEEDGTSSLAATSSTAAAAGSSSSSSAGKHSTSGIFSKTDETILDHPIRLNLEEAKRQLFLDGENNIEEQSSSNNVWLEKVYCGASGTAMVLNDGRCFVMGSNKNGELG